LAEFKRILELDPLHEEAMQWAGNLSATLGRNEEARTYYQRYLQLDPTNAAVRMRVAYELAQAGDAYGAMELIEEGLAHEPENVELLKQHGGFAFTAGASLNQGQEEMPQEARRLFRKALTSYDKAYAVEGAEMEVVFLTNMVKAYMNLDEVEEALAFAERILETHASEAEVWSTYANALQRSGQIDEAVTALDRAIEIQPDLANAGARQGRWLLDEERVEDAVRVLQSAVARGEKTADEVSELVFVNGYQKGVQPEEWSYAIRTLRAAKEFEITAEMREKVDFFLGYSILKDAIDRQEARTKESAQATLPLFQQARSLLQAAAGYAQRQGRLENDRLSLLDNIGTFIEIQEAIIKRGL
jgi:tetratricopeptide (TPR) repeat protein